MNARDLLARQMEDAGYQLGAVLEGMAETTLDSRLAAGSMSPREVLEHLGETYQAVLTTIAGGKHEWGTYQAPDRSTPALMENFGSLRALAVSALLKDEREEAFAWASDYIIGHDYYHVGQLAAIRLDREPDWSAYSIYR